jgi:glyceraldehyde-3-phosphate dehydrogenase (NAD(P))
LCRTLYPLYRDFGIDNVKAVMIRRAADPGDSKKGPINAIEPVLKVPSHHGPDVQTVIPDLNISTMAVKAPTTIMHLHSVIVELKKEVSTEDILNVWDKTPRVKFVKGADGVKSTAQIMEMARDMGRNRSDMYEIIVWKDGVHVDGKTLYYSQAIHQESDVVPENIDCIRAMMKLESDKMKSIEKTDNAMGIK